MCILWRKLTTQVNSIGNFRKFFSSSILQQQPLRRTSNRLSRERESYISSVRSQTIEIIRKSIQQEKRRRVDMWQSTKNRDVVQLIKEVVFLSCTYSTLNIDDGCSSELACDRTEFCKMPMHERLFEQDINVKLSARCPGEREFFLRRMLRRSRLFNWLRQ